MMLLALLAALAVDSVTGTAPNATTPLSQITACTSPCTQTPSFTNTAGTLLVCGIAAAVSTGSTISISSVTYGGDAMTLEQSTAYNTNAEVGAVYSRLSPKTGANNLSFTLTAAAGGFDRGTAGCISFTGNDAATPVIVGTKFTSAVNGTTTLGGTMTSTTAGNILVMLGQGGEGTATAPTGTAIYAGADDGSTAGGKQTMQQRAAGGSVALTWTQAISDWGAGTGIEVAASAGGAAVPQRSLMGVGQ